MSHVPDDLKYTKGHEWIADTQIAQRVRMGITDFAQSALGDIVYVQLPNVGEKVTAGKVCGEVESTKSVSEIYAPVSGTIAAINDSLVGAPETLNSDPYGQGWLCEIVITEHSADLLSAQQYIEITA